MESEMVLADRDALLTELRRVFDAQTAETVLGVLERVAAQLRAMGVRGEDFSELKQIVAELVQAQRRTEEQLKVLVKTQQRTEQRLDALILRVDELTQAQQRTEQRLDELAQALQRLGDTVDSLKGRMLEGTTATRLSPTSDVCCAVYA